MEEFHMRAKIISLTLALLLCAGLAAASPALAAGEAAYSGDGYAITRTRLPDELQGEQYLRLSSFSEGLAAVGKPGAGGEMAFGYIDRSGRIAIPLQYGVAGPFQDGLARVGYLEFWESDDGDQGGINSRLGFIDKSGDVVIPIEYDFLNDFSEGLAAAGNYDEAGMGFMDRTGAFVIPRQYGAANSFQEGLAAVMQGDVEHGGAWGFIDRTGKAVVPFEYDQVGDFSEGLASVEKDGQKFYIDKIGQIAIPAREIHRGSGAAFHDGRAEVMGKDFKFGLMDKSGKVVAPMEYHSVRWLGEGRFAVTKQDNGGAVTMGIIDQDGKAVTQLEYDGSIESYSEGLAPVKKYARGGGAGWPAECVYVDLAGKAAINPFAGVEYIDVDARPFSEGFAKVGYRNSSGGHYVGYIDRSGKAVVPMEYDDLTLYSGEFSEGIVFARKDGVLYLLEKSGGGMAAPGPDTPAAPDAPPPITASPASATVVVNGESVAFDAYNIGGSNYFKLRDLAYALSGTEKQFDVGWDGAANAISLTGGRQYTAVGGEMDGKGAGNKAATPTGSKIRLDGAEVSFTAYNIGGNNYFKLRDVGEAFDFGVAWDGASNTVMIDTGAGYTPG
jgi:hypothetical protein